MRYLKQYLALVAQMLQLTRGDDSILVETLGRIANTSGTMNEKLHSTKRASA
jgi:hypothetical protein